MKYLPQRLLMGFLLLAATAVEASWTRDAVMDLVAREAVANGIPISLALAVARVESDFQADARSHVGARGVMQIMPATAEGELGVARSQLYDPAVNVPAGLRFLRQLLDRYDNRVDIALSHYNGGSRVRRPNGELRVIPATRPYVRKVMLWDQRYAEHPLAQHEAIGRKGRLASLDDLGGARQRYALAGRGLPSQGATLPLPRKLSAREQAVQALRALARRNEQRYLR